MKKHILFAILLGSVLINTISYAQWFEQQSGTNAQLWDIRFINNNTGYICGDGIILKTENAGTNWNPLTLPPEITNKTFYCMSIINNTVIYAVGGFNAVIKSTDGGSTWSVLRNSPIGVGNSYFAVDFINENTGWISGSGFAVLRTTNGGANFSSTSIPNSGIIKDMYFKNELEGLIAGNGSTIRRTTNGGLTFDTVTIPVENSNQFLSTLSFINNETGYLISEQRQVFKTTDFGFTWDSLARIPGIPSSGNLIFNAVFSSGDTGYATGGETTYKTVNGGSTWVQEDFPVSPPPGAKVSISFINNMTGWVCSNLGRIYKTTTGGAPLVGIEPIGNGIPEKMNLYQNYPNPFNPSTGIRFDIPVSAYVTLRVFDINGREVRTLVSSNLRAGSYETTFSGETSGVYFYRLTAGDFVETRKMLLVK